MAFRRFYSTLMLLVLVACVNARTFYEILGVEKNATPREVKKGYMKQVLKYHPDKNDAPDATQKFMEVTTAYECLSDPELRKKYDSIGHDAYVGTKQSERRSQERQEQYNDPFSKFESFFRSEQKSSTFENGGEDDDFFKSFFSEFEETFESHGFGDGGAQFMSRKTFRRSGDGGIKMEMDGFLNMDDILFDPLWNGEEEEEDPGHFGSGRSFFGGGHFVPPAPHAFFDAPHSSAHARAHAHAHQQHHNAHQQNHNVHQHHRNIHQHNIHQHHNFHHQHQHQSSKHHHPNQFHHQQEFNFFSSDGDSEEDVFGEGMFGFSNVFSDSSSGPKEFSFKSSSSSSTSGGGGSRSGSQKTYSYESTSSTGGTADGSKASGRQQTCTVSKRVDSMGNVRESKTCS